MDQALAQWRAFYGVEDAAFESLISIILTNGSCQQTSSTGDVTQLSQRGFAPNMPSRPFDNDDYGDSSGATRVPLIAPTTSPFLQPYSNAMPVQNIAMEADPYMGYVSSAQDAVAAPLINNIVSETLQGLTQSSVAASQERLLRSCINCWAAKKKVSVGHPL